MLRAATVAVLHIHISIISTRATTTATATTRARTRTRWGSRTRLVPVNKEQTVKDVELTIEKKKKKIKENI